MVAIGTGCVRKIYIPTERLAHDTVMRTRLTVDTIMARDSIVLEQRGDTVVREVYRWRTRTHTRHDTIYQSRVDSIPIIVEIEKSPKTTTIKSRIKTILAMAGVVLTCLILSLLYVRQKLRN